MGAAQIAGIVICGAIALFWIAAVIFDPVQNGMRLLQLAIVAAVGCLGIYLNVDHAWQVFGLLGIAAAWLLTVVPLKLALWFRTRRLRGGSQ